MNPRLKKRLQWVVGLCAVALLALIVTPMLVHPNQYRTPIASLVKGLTGRTLTIRGEVSLSLFPSVELILREVSLADDPAFGEEPLARVATLVVGVQFVPLLSGRLAVDRAEMRGLHLKLLRDEKGRSNLDAWMMPVEGEKPPTEASSAPAEALLSRLLALSVAGVELSGATVTWRDAVHAQDGRLDQLDLKTGPIHPGRPVAVTAGFRFLEAKSGLTGRADTRFQLRSASGGRFWADGLEVNASAALASQKIKDFKARFTSEVALDWRAQRAEWSRMELAANLWTEVEWLREWQLGYQGKMEMDLAKGRWVAPGSLFKVLLKADSLPPAGVQARVVSDLIVESGPLAVTLDRVEIEGPAGLRIKGEMRSRERLSRIEGTLQAERFDFRALLIALGRTIPSTTDIKVCSGAEAEVDFTLTSRELTLSRLSLGMDASHLTGSLAVGLRQPEVRFDWEVDDLDLDRFRPLVLGQEWSWPGGWPAPERVIDGRVRFGQMSLAGGHWSDGALVIDVAGGVARLDPVIASAHGGRMAGRVVWDNREAEPVLQVSHVVEGVRAASWFQELGGWGGVDGALDGVVHLEARGRDREAWLRTLRGQGQFLVRDGVVSGVDVVGRIRQAHAQFTRARVPAQGVEETRFVTLGSMLMVQEGVVSHGELELRGPNVRISGSGQVDLPKRRIDYALQADVASGLQGAVADSERYTGLTLPIQWRGAWEAAKKFEYGAVDFSRLSVPAAEEKANPNH
ncbi:MAG: AsmA family protein [Magnetococcales bacterium]|nr:AsmA family protein [Magnetococcales bacterium]